MQTLLEMSPTTRIYKKHNLLCKLYSLPVLVWAPTTVFSPSSSMKTCSKQYCKRNSMETESFDEDDLEYETILPGLPNHLAHLCLSLVPPSLLFSVCRSWRRLLYSPSFPPFFSLYALLSPSLSTHVGANSVRFFSLDPVATTWRPLPGPPQDPPLRLLHRHPSFLSRNLPIQSLTVSNHLILVAATTDRFLPGLSRPLVFHPEAKTWSFGPPLSVPRRWCVAGSLNGAVYVASGVGTHYQGEVARSVESWDLKTKRSEEWKWEKKAALKDGRFSRETVEAVGYRGKLCVVNVKGNAVKDGAVYDVERNQWEIMREGMLAGWNGPAATMDETVMYVVDEAKGALSRYDHERDCWEEVIEMGELKRAEQIVAGRGRVCVVCAGGKSIVVVDMVVTPVRAWAVEPPQAMEVVAVHILPRMSKERWHNDIHDDGDDKASN